MVDILKLKNDKNNLKVRDIIMSGGDVIRVFEPTPEHIDIILELQEQWIEKGKVKVEFPAAVLVRKLFPLLTDIKGIEELDDEAIQDIIENPSLAFSKVQIVIETIIAEIYETILLNAKYQITMTNYEVEAYRANREGFEKTLAQAAKETGSEDLYSKIADWSDNVIELKKQEEAKEEEKKVAKLDEQIGQTNKSIHEQLAMIERYRKEFSDLEGSTIL